VLRIVISFFAGVLATLYLLVPGNIEPGDLFDTEKRGQLAQFDCAGDRIEQGGDLATFYAYKAKNYVQHHIGETP